MNQSSGAGPPWNSVEEMLIGYRSRLSAFVTSDALFHYKDRVQYERKLTTYASILRGYADAVGPLLDVGCGIGNLLNFYAPVDAYLGIDVIPEFVALARAIHPTYRFETANLLEAKLPRHHTVALVGALGTSPEPMELLLRASDLADRHLVFDYLPTTGSAEGIHGLRTLAPRQVDELLIQEGWSSSRSVRLGGSAVIVICERCSSDLPGGVAV